MVKAKKVVEVAKHAKAKALTKQRAAAAVKVQIKAATLQVRRGLMCVFDVSLMCL